MELRKRGKLSDNDDDKGREGKGREKVGIKSEDGPAGGKVSRHITITVETRYLLRLKAHDLHMTSLTVPFHGNTGTAFLPHTDQPQSPRYSQILIR